LGEGGELELEGGRARTAAALCWGTGVGVWSGARHSANGGVLLWGGVSATGTKEEGPRCTHTIH